MPGKVTFTLTGTQQMQHNLQAMNQRMEHAVMSALYAIGQNVRTDAMEHTPVDTGTLRASHYVALPERVGNRIVTEVGAGGWAKSYAVPVHDRTWVHHKVGEAKWLENAFKRLSATFLADAAKLVAHFFARGGGPPTKQVISDPYEGPDLRRPSEKARRPRG